MFYVQEITATAGGSAASPQRTDLKVWAGVIHQVEIMFPPGCAGLVHVTIWHGGHQIWPSTEGQNFADDGETIKFMDQYALTPGWNMLRIETYNTDDTYNHTIRARFGVLPFEAISTTQALRRLAETVEYLAERIRQVF